MLDAYGDDAPISEIQELKHPPVLGTTPAPNSAEMAKAARLNSNRFRRPTASDTSIGKLRYAKKALSV
jgi:hypothetical protein